MSTNPFFKELDQIISEMITDLENQNPNIDISQGSVMFIKSVAFSSAIWGCYKYLDYVKDQIFPDTSDRENLERHASVLGVTIDQNDTDTTLLKKVLDRLRNPTAGGNRYDVARWSKSVSTASKDVALTDNKLIGSSLTGSGWNTAPNYSNLNDLGVKAIGLNSNGSSSGAFIQAQFIAETELSGVAFFVAGKGHPGRFTISGSNGGTTFNDLALNWTIGADGWNFIEFNKIKLTHLKIILDASHTTTSANIMELKAFVVTEEEEEATEVVVFDNSPNPGQFETLPYKTNENSEKEQLSAKTLAQIQVVVDELKPVGTYGFAILPLMTKSVPVSINVTGTNIDTAYIRTGIESLLANMKPGQTLFRESIIAVAVQNGAQSVTISAPSANVTANYYETIISGGVVVVLV